MWFIFRLKPSSISPHFIFISIHLCFVLTTKMISARVAANAAILFSVLAIIGCALFIPAIIAKINKITADLEADINEFNELQAKIWATAVNGEKLTGEEAKMDHKNGKIAGFLLEKIRRHRRQTASEPVAAGQCVCLAENKCPAGPPGAKGQRGKDGEAGKRGMPGPSGQHGTHPPVTIQHGEVMCRMCPSGPPGYPGPPGEAGIDGQSGPDGPPGEKGQQGHPGMPGPQGMIGEPGSAGKNGQPGNPGRNGAIGGKGEPGVQGAKGKPGQQGNPGRPGQDGKPGQPGKPGATGHAGDGGNRGQKGPPGDMGDNGEPGKDANYCRCPRRTGKLLTY